MTAVENYLPTRAYQALISALANVKPDPLTGKLEPHCFVEVLGEVGNIWPASALDDSARQLLLGKTNFIKRI